jgi:hypothetical protein
VAHWWNLVRPPNLCISLLAPGDAHHPMFPEAYAHPREHTHAHAEHLGRCQPVQQASISERHFPALCCAALLDFFTENSCDCSPIGASDLILLIFATSGSHGQDSKPSISRRNLDQESRIHDEWQTAPPRPTMSSSRKSPAPCF